MSAECRGDRAVEARRGQLSAAQRVAHEVHVQSCESCRLLLEIGSDFDALAQPSWDDGARIERLAARMVAAQRAPRRKRLARTTALAACLLLFTGVAGAAALGLLRPRAPTLVASFNAARPRSSAALPRVQPRALTQPAVSAAPLGPEPAPSNSAMGALESAPAQAQATRVAAAPPSAALVFRSANDARRSGQAQKAVKLYRALQHDYPGSPEAALSLVSLGNLLLSADATGAIEQFDRYLVASPRGAVVAEALYGRGRALQGLGRTAEERTTWQELLARYPSCPYRDRALRRLAELQ